MTTTVTLATGSTLSFPFPPPMTLDTDNPSVLAITLTREGAQVKGTSAGTAWLNVGIAADLKASVQVTVQDAETMARAGTAPAGQAARPTLHK